MTVMCVDVSLPPWVNMITGLQLVPTDLVRQHSHSSLSQLAMIKSLSERGYGFRKSLVFLCSNRWKTEGIKGWPPLSRFLEDKGEWQESGSRNAIFPSFGLTIFSKREAVILYILTNFCNTINTQYFHFKPCNLTWCPTVPLGTSDYVMFYSDTSSFLSPNHTI